MEGLRLPARAAACLSHLPGDRGLIHQNRRRAESFGEDAERYDRARPSYPSALIDDLVAEKPAHVLDVGSGTGKAARLTAARGCEVLGVEPDGRMAAVARFHGVSVEVATFETWDPRGRMFDLVMSGQAWHWIDPEVGPGKAAALLLPGGRLAVFWNRGRHDAPTQMALDHVYRQHAPGLVKDALPTAGEAAKDRSSHVAAIAATGRFDTPQLLGYTWERQCTRDEWLDQLGTHSDHLLLPPAQLAALLDAVGAAIDRLGGSIAVRYQTQLIMARRRRC